MKRLLFAGFLITAALTFLDGNSQLAIIGPDCVLSGMQYQYNIAGNIPSGTRLCISGGKLSDSSTCDNDLSSGFVKIVWSGKSGSVTLTSDGGNVSKAIRITLPLQPGDIEINGKKQFIKYNNSPTAISCSLPTGGGCGASYSFQWQRSLDNLDWENISGATSQNLSSVNALTETYFYRRRTIENISGSIVYSNSAVVYVAPDTHGD